MCRRGHEVGQRRRNWVGLFPANRLSNDDVVRPNGRGSESTGRIGRPLECDRAGREARTERDDHDNEQESADLDRLQWR
jgi:hypothetical protein